MIDVGPYSRAFASLVDRVVEARPELTLANLVLGAPGWFVQRLAAETVRSEARSSRGSDIIEVGGIPIAALSDPNADFAGRFVAHDLVGGDCFVLSWRAHPSVDPSRWGCTHNRPGVRVEPRSRPGPRRNGGPVTIRSNDLPVRLIAPVL
jgi:hypothetical protein